MHRRFNILTGVGLAILLTACGQGASSPSSTATDLQYPAQTWQGDSTSVTSDDYSRTAAAPTFDRPFSNVQNGARGGVLYCESPSQCNPSVVMISGVSGDRVSRCTGTLISEDQVLTNDHCIKHLDFAQNNSPCKDQLFVHFTGVNGVEPQVASCDSIRFRSHESGTDSKDYAVIQLDRKITDRAPVQLSQRGFNDHEPATLVRVQMITGPQGELNGVQSRLSCEAEYQTMLYPAIQDARAPLMSFGNCVIASGNSGSPIFNSNGEMGAVIQGYFSIVDRTDILDQMRQFQFEDPLEMITVGTQTACMDGVPFSTDKKLCQASTRAVGLAPKDYLAMYSWKVPAKIDSTLWTRLPGGTPTVSNFIRLPECLNAAKDQQISFPARRFRSGIDRNYDIQWRPADGRSDDTISFKVTSITTDTVYLDHARYGNLSVPLCK